MTAAELVLYARRLDVRLWLHGDRLRYSAPEGGLTPDLRDLLSARKGEIADWLRARTPEAPPMRPPLRPLPRTGAPLPASFAQRRLWFLQQLEPASTAYNIASAIRLEGPLDLRALADTFDEVVQRHEVLRTTSPAWTANPCRSSPRRASSHCLSTI